MGALEYARAEKAIRRKNAAERKKKERAENERAIKELRDLDATIKSVLKEFDGVSGLKFKRWTEGDTIFFTLVRGKKEIATAWAAVDFVDKHPGTEYAGYSPDNYETVYLIFYRIGDHERRFSSRRWDFSESFGRAMADHIK